jgi:hypothetical protein
MERRRGAGWTGRPRPQRASANGASPSLRVTTPVVPPAPLPALHAPTSSKIPSSTTLTACAIRDGFRPFLTGSAPQTEFVVTHSKQRTGNFLTGARTAIKLFIIRQPRTQEFTRRGGRERYHFHGFNTFLPGSARKVEFDVTHSKQTTATFLPGARTADRRLAAQLSNRRSNFVFRFLRLPLIALIEGGKP